MSSSSLLSTAAAAAALLSLLHQKVFKQITPLITLSLKFQVWGKWVAYLHMLTDFDTSVVIAT